MTAPKNPRTDEDVDGLLESLLTDDGYREEQPTLPIDPEPPVPSAGRPSKPPSVHPPVPRPRRSTPVPAPSVAPTEKPRMPKPVAPRIPRPGVDATAQPPPVNPAGPARREPFLPATSPPPGPARRPARGLPKGLDPGIDESEIDAALMPLSFHPAAPSMPPTPSQPPTPNQPQSGENITEVPTFVPPPGDAAVMSEGFIPRTSVPVLEMGAEEVDDLVPIGDDAKSDEAPITRASAHLEPDDPGRQSTGESGAPAISIEEASASEAPIADDWHEDSVTSILATETDLIGSEPREIVPSEAQPRQYKDAPSASVESPPSAHAPEDRSSERPAALHLGDHRLAEAWVARAEWFEAEAQTAGDPLAKARLSIAASELWAMSGNTARAREAAELAARGAPSIGLGARQARLLAAMEGDWKAVAAALDAEARNATTEAARAHATYVGAEVHRLALHDAQGSQRRQTLLMRAAPADPRPHLSQLSAELGSASAPPKVKLPDATEFAALAAAVNELVRLRGGGAVGDSRSAALAFQDARRALAGSDRAAAGAAVIELGAIPGLGDGALFLGAALLAPAAETRAASILAVRQLLERTGEPAVRRALAARSLEQGDPEGMREALTEADSGVRTFGAEDRIALSALTGGDPAELAHNAEALAADDELRPLAAAAVSANALSGNLPVGDPATRARLSLGRRIPTVASPDELKDVVHALRAAAPDEQAGRVLALELDAAAGATSAVAAEVARLAPIDIPAHGKLAAALIEEVSGHADLARRHYTAALGSPDVAEAAARALIQPDDSQAAGLLSTLSSSLGDEATPRQALLLFEAAVRSGIDHPENTEDLLGRAHDAAPSLPFAARLGGDLARSRGDVAKVLEWLRRQRDAARDPIARALDAVREALLVADDDPKAATGLLNEALEGRPDDVALHELAERLDSTPSRERGAWRERIASSTSDARTKSWLLFEAATEFERCGALEDATRTARASAATEQSELAVLLQERLSPKAETTPKDGLAGLRVAEHVAFTLGDDDRIESTARRLSELEDHGESLAHARLAFRLASKTEPWESLRPLVELVARRPAPSLWALRQASAHARVQGDDARLLEVERALEDRVTRSLDKGTLALRAAEAAARLGQLDEARTLLSRTLAAIPGHLVALDLRATVSERLGDRRAAAEDAETLAQSSSVSDHQWDAWYRAATLWLDESTDPDRGLQALERAAGIDVTRKDVFDRLQALYVERGDRKKLASLLEARLAKTDAPEERLLLEVTRGRALAEVGDRDAARHALRAALDANPDHADALEVFATLCLADGAFHSAEESFIRLARVVNDPEKQVEIYRRLAGLYDVELPNPTRAEICYREILKRRPYDAGATQSLVRVYVRLEQPARAVQLQNELVERAGSADEKRDRTIELSRIYDESAGDKKSAFAILEKARKAWPHDSVVLRAVADAHRRHDEMAALNVLLDRAAAEARRALAHGRFDAAFFGILEATAELRGHADGASVAGATAAAIEGKPDVEVRGAGAAASSPALDDLLAPELLSSALRTLLKKLPAVLDAAYPVDLRALRAGPMPPARAEFAAEIRAVAESMGVRSLELLVSPALSSVAIPAQSFPARIVLGQGLLDVEDEAARYFCLVRALKIVQVNGGAFARIAPIDLWPATAALLSALAPGFQAQGVDAAKLADAKRRIDASLPPRRDEELATLALEVGGAIGNRASQLGQAVGQWASRTALLAVGSPSIALRGVALSLGQGEPPPTDPTERMKWVLRQPEAKDLATFSVSDGYAEARRQVGLGA